METTTLAPPSGLLDAIRFDANGLVPVIAQQRDTGVILMVAWMNRQALAETLATGAMCYWSRSRQSLWRKGETSGQTQRLVELMLDCDGDTLLAVVEQTGVACHTGRLSCFFRQAVDGAWTDISPIITDPGELYGTPEEPMETLPGEVEAPQSDGDALATRNRRQAWRFNLKMNVELYYRGYTIELPLKDLSSTGAAVDSCGVDHLQTEDQCVLTLPNGTEVSAVIVATDNGLLRVRFAEDAAAEVRQLVRAVRPKSSE